MSGALLNGMTPAELRDRLLGNGGFLGLSSFAGVPAAVAARRGRAEIEESRKTLKAAEGQRRERRRVRAGRPTSAKEREEDRALAATIEELRERLAEYLTAQAFLDSEERVAELVAWRPTQWAVCDLLERGAGGPYWTRAVPAMDSLAAWAEEHMATWWRAGETWPLNDGNPVPALDVAHLRETIRRIREVCDQLRKPEDLPSPRPVFREPVIAMRLVRDVGQNGRARYAGEIVHVVGAPVALALVADRAAIVHDALVEAGPDFVAERDDWRARNGFDPAPVEPAPPVATEATEDPRARERKERAAAATELARLMPL